MLWEIADTFSEAITTSQRWAKPYSKQEYGSMQCTRRTCHFVSPFRPTPSHAAVNEVRVIEPTARLRRQGRSSSLDSPHLDARHQQRI